MRKITTLLPTLFILLLACNKDVTNKPRNCNPGNDGNLSAIIENKTWTACEFKAVYYPKANLLAINAIDENSNFEFRFFITTDTITPLKVYNINAYENNGLEIVQSLGNESSLFADIYYCDLLKPGIGGTISITNLDTTTGKVSATFNVTGYSDYQHKNLTVSNGNMDNIKLINSPLFYDSSYMRAKVNGINWYSKQVYAGVNEYIQPTNISFLDIIATGYPDDLGDCPKYLDTYSRTIHGNGERRLRFNIPLALGKGTYPLQSGYYQTSASQHYLFDYSHRNTDNLYFPLTGSSISVTSIDTTNRNLDLDFTTLAKDSSGNTINFTEGKIYIRDWQKFR